MALPSDLSTHDSGLLVWVVDYNHLIRWSGAAWEWAPGEVGSGFIRDFLATPGPEWVLCDGSATDYLVVTPTPAAVAITLPNDPGTAPYARFFRR
jgi:hypothetical protein